MRNQAIDEYLMDVFGAKLQKQWLGAARSRSYQSEFLDKGYFILPMGLVTRDLLMTCYDDRNRITLNDHDCASGHYTFPFNSDLLAQLNAKHSFYGEPAPAGCAHLESFLEGNKTIIEQQLGSPFEVCNVRIEALRAGSAYGPSAWHADGGPRFLRKILLYPGPLNKDENGALEFFDRHGVRRMLESDGPVAVLYDTSFLLHRGHPPKQDQRPMIEITLKPAEKSVVKPVFPGHLARVPEMDDAALDAELRELKARRIVEVAALNQTNAWALKAPQPSRLGHLAARIGRIRSFRHLLRGLERRLFGAKTDTSQMQETYEAGPLPYIGGQISNRSAMLHVGPAQAAFDPGWFHWDSGGDVGAVIPVSARSISLAYVVGPMMTRGETEIAAIFDELRRVLSMDGHLLLGMPDKPPLNDDYIRPLLARHGFEIVSFDTRRIGADYKWIPELRRSKMTDRHYLTKCA